MCQPRIVLASSSPRRRELLSQLGLVFTVRSRAVNEELPGGMPLEAAMGAVAMRKALAVAELEADAIVIGADTAVVVEGRALGKPLDRADAERTLHQLSGRVHQVMTGVALCRASDGLRATFTTTTAVTFATLSTPQIARYVATGEPLDKAGAYGIQGYAAAFVAHLEGCYFNVVGLPLAALSEALANAGVDVTARWPRG